MTYVAPFTGAWIEIACKWPPALYGGPVAPFTGAWIEIRNLENPKVTKTESHPSRVRGLKYRRVENSVELETSHPSRVRGLKYADRGRSGGRGWSHPLRVRGLKYPYYPARWVQCEVAPFTGAWIEIAYLRRGCL